MTNKHNPAIPRPAGLPAAALCVLFFAFAAHAQTLQPFPDEPERPSWCAKPLAAPAGSNFFYAPCGVGEGANEEEALKKAVKEARENSKENHGLFTEDSTGKRETIPHQGVERKQINSPGIQLPDGSFKVYAMFVTKRLQKSGDRQDEYVNKELDNEISNYEKKVNEYNRKMTARRNEINAHKNKIESLFKFMDIELTVADQDPKSFEQKRIDAMDSTLSRINNMYNALLRVESDDSIAEREKAFTLRLHKLKKSRSDGTDIYANVDDAVVALVKEIGSSAQGKNKVVVMNIKTPDLGDRVSEYITDKLLDRLEKNGKFKAVIKQEDALNEAHKKRDIPVLNDKSAVEIGKRVGAKTVITGSYNRDEAYSRLKLNVIDVGTDNRALPSARIRPDDKTLENIIRSSGGEKSAAVPHEAVKHLDNGKKMLEKGKTDKAIVELSKALKISGNLAEAYVYRGDAYVKKREYKIAVADYKDAMRLRPNYAKAHCGLGDVYLKMGENDSAIAEYNRAILLYPNYAEAYSGRCDVYREKGDTTKAMDDCNRAIRLDPTSSEAYISRGLVYYDKGDYDKTIADYSQAIRLDPNYALAYNNRGYVYYKKGDYDKAIADVNKAIRLNPNVDLYYNNRGNAYCDKGNYNKAIVDYNKAIQLNPNSAVYYDNRGYAYYNKDNYDRAIVDYNKAIQLDPNNATYYNDRGNVYYVNSNNDRAIADYNKAIQLGYNDAKTYKHRGDVFYYGKSDYDRAIADYESALRLDPDYAKAKQSLEALRRKLSAQK